MRRRQKEHIFDRDEDQDFSRRRNRNSGVGSRSRSRSSDRIRFDDGQQDNQYESQQSHEEGSSNNPSQKSNKQITAQTYAIQIREIILDFFGKIKHEKGFVYTPQQRLKLQKQQQRLLKKDKNHKKIEWTANCQWKQEGEKLKIDALFAKEQFPIAFQKVQFLKGIFLNTSYLFGIQTTPELYLILMRIVKICLANQPNAQAQVKEFMSSILSDTTQFRFFNFNFSSYHKLPSNNQTNELIYHDFGQKIYMQIQQAINK